jgi:hypothetical protein
LRRALEHSTEHPDQHDQRVWARRRNCGGVVVCISYHVAIMCGHQVNWGAAEGQHVAWITDNRLLYWVVRAKPSSWPAMKPTGYATSNTIEGLWPLAAEFTNSEITERAGERRHQRICPQLSRAAP